MTNLTLKTAKIFFTIVILLIFIANIGASQQSVYSLRLLINPNADQDFDENKVYTTNEVDVKAVIKKSPRPKPVMNWNCPSKGEVLLKIILHKSGKVTNIEVIKGIKCGYEQKAIEAAQKIKFVPATKTNRPVSQYAEVGYRYDLK